MPEHVSREEGVEEPAQLDLTVRDAILAAAELISDVPIPRSPAGAGEPRAGSGSADDAGRPPGGQRDSEAVRGHG